MCKQPLESLSFSKVICLYAWQDSLGTPRWCAGTVPCSRRSRHFLPVAPWCSSLSPSATGSMPSWAAIIHWRRSTNGTPREASLSHLRSWISRHLEHFLWFPLTTGCSFSHPASREKHRYMSTSWSIWAIKPSTNSGQIVYTPFKCFLLWLESTSKSHLSLRKVCFKQKLKLFKWYLKCNSASEYILIVWQHFRNTKNILSRVV